MLLLPQNLLGKECVWTRGLVEPVWLFSKERRKAESLTCAVAAPCYHNTYDILTCPHTLECVSAAQAFGQNNGPQRSQQMIKAPVCPCFLGCFFFFVSFDFIVSRRFFIPTLFCQSVVKECGSQVKAVSPGWFGPCLALFCLAEQTAPGQREGRIEGSAQGTGALSPVAGWVARTPGVQREPFFFVLCRQNGGSCCCLGASAETVQDPPPRLSAPPASLLSHRTAVTHSLTHSHIPVHPSPVPDQLGVCSVFVDAQESEQSRRPPRGREDFYCVSCQAKALFIATKEIPCKRVYVCK